MATAKGPVYDVPESAISLEKLCLEEPEIKFSLDDYAADSNSDQQKFYDRDDEILRYQAETYDLHIQCLRQTEREFRASGNATVESTRKMLEKMAHWAGAAAEAAREIARMRQEALDMYGRGLLDPDGGETEEYRNHAVLPPLWRDTIAGMYEMKKTDCQERAARLLL